MACALRGELKCKDGRTSKFTVETENNLKSTIEGVKRINSEISVVLTDLVEEEKRARGVERGESRARDEDEEDEGDEEDDDDDDEDATVAASAVKLKSEPPAKRLKPITRS